MEDTEKVQATQRLAELLHVACIGGPFQARRMLDAAEESGLPNTILELNPVTRCWGKVPVRAVLEKALDFSNLITVEPLQHPEPLVTIGARETRPGKWLAVFIAVLAWRALVQPDWEEQTKPTKRQDRDKRLHQLIARIPTTYVGSVLTELLDEILATAEGLGWDQATTNYVLGTGGTVGRSTKAPAVLALCENRLWRIDGNSVLIEDGSGITVFEFADKRFMQIVAALDQRRKNLAIRWQ